MSGSREAHKTHVHLMLSGDLYPRYFSPGLRVVFVVVVFVTKQENWLVTLGVLY
jgi:hypothetical protein